MKQGSFRLAWLAVLFLLAPLLRADVLAEARQCTQEPSRLARLACFDALFGTPADSPAPVMAPEAHRSERWRQAYAQAQEGPARVRDTGDLAGWLVTLSALGTQPPRPLLTLQCHNNITELALMVPEPLAAERVRVSLGGEASQWRVRDEGFVISAGRGLPAIRLARALLHQQDIDVVASVPALDGLVFDLAGLAEAVAPLRQQCGW